MAFALTLIYVVSSLLSPVAFSASLIDLHIDEILGVILILITLIGIPNSEIRSLPDPYLVLGILGAALVSTLTSGWMGHVVYTFTSFIPALVPFYFIALNVSTLRRMRIFAAFLGVSALFILVHGAMAYSAADVASPYLLGGTDGSTLHRIRGLGVLSDPNDLAQFFVTVIPLLWLRWKTGGFASNLLLTIIPSVALIYGIFLTHSRGGTIALIAIVLFGLRGRFGVVKSVLFAAAAGAALLYANVGGGRGMNQDDGGRVGLWYTGFMLIRAHPILGVGMGNFSNFTENGLTAHNSYVLCLAELGLFGYFFWLGSIVSAFLHLNGMSPRLRRDPAEAANEMTDVSPAFGTLTPSVAFPSSITAQTSKYFQPSFAAAASGSSALTSGMPSTASSLGSTRRAFGSAMASMLPSGPDEATDEAEAEGIPYAARILRVSFVGFLVSAFFLSRAYHLVIFLILGLVCALTLIHRRHFTPVDGIRPPLVKRIVQVLAASLVFLYIFIRLQINS